MRRLFALIAFAAGVAAAAPALAQVQAPQDDPAVLRQVYDCTSIADDAARLACFDAAVSGLRAAQAEGSFAAIDREQAAELNREAFGFNLPSLPRLGLPRLGGGEDRPAELEVSEVNMVIERVSRAGDGDYVFIMTNGQRWEQVSNERVSMIRPGGEVRIRRAAMGSYLMIVEAGGPAQRVRRVQ
jgi:hypothetical protein